MVEAVWTRRIVALGALVGVGLMPGCAVVPKSRLDECHNLSRNLQARNSQLEDATLTLRSQNQDLTQRAVDDARRLQAQGDEVERLEQSVLAYQKERDQLGRAFESLKRQIQVQVSSHDPGPIATPVAASDADGPGALAPALLGRLGAFAREHPGTSFDPAATASTFDLAPLFEPGTDRLTADGIALLDAYATLLAADEASGVVARVAIAEGADPAVRRAGLVGSDDGPPPRLGLDRARRVRDRLAGPGGIDPARIEVASDAAPGPAGRGLAIRLRRPARSGVAGP